MDTDTPRIPLSDKAREARRQPNYFLIPGEYAPPAPSSGKARIVKVYRAAKPGAPKPEEINK